jgi:hypothetical protein
MLLLAAVGLHAQATTSPSTAPAAGASWQGAPAANAFMSSNFYHFAQRLFKD